MMGPVAWVDEVFTLTLLPWTIGLDNVPTPSMVMSTMSPGRSVNSVVGTIPVPVIKKAPSGKVLSRPSQPTKFSKLRAIWPAEVC